MIQHISQADPKILIVDDDHLASLLHARVLKNCGLNNTPSFFSNGQTALDYLQEFTLKNTPVLVLLDLEMPVMNGWEFLERCKELEPDSRVYVIIISSTIQKEDLYRALEFKNLISLSSKPLSKESMKPLLEFPAVKELFLDMEYQAFENDLW